MIRHILCRCTAALLFAASPLVAAQNVFLDNARQLTELEQDVARLNTDILEAVAALRAWDGYANYVELLADHQRAVISREKTVRARPSDSAKNAANKRVDEARGRVTAVIDAETRLSTIRQLGRKATSLRERYATTRTRLVEYGLVLDDARRARSAIDELTAAAEKLESQIRTASKTVETPDSPQRERSKQLLAAANVDLLSVRKSIDALRVLQAKVAARLSGTAEGAVDETDWNDARDDFRRQQERWNAALLKLDEAAAEARLWTFAADEVCVVRFAGRVVQWKTTGVAAIAASHAIVGELDMLACGANGRAHLAFEAGDTLFLGPRSQFRFETDDSDTPRRIYYLKQGAFRLMQHPERVTTNIHTPHGGGLAKGCDIIVRVEGEFAEFFIRNGVFSFTDAEGVTTEVEAGRRCTIREARLESGPAAYDAESYDRVCRELFADLDLSVQ